MPLSPAPCDEVPSAPRSRLGWFVRVVAVLACWAAAMPLWAATAAPVTLKWNPNREKDLAGYELRYGTSPGKYTATVKAGLNTKTTVKGLAAGKRYYCVVRAYNRAGQRSAPSKEISFRASLPNRAPTAVSRTHSTKQGQAVRITLAGKDPERSRLTYRIVSRPRHGTLSGKAPKLTYQPAKGFTGTDRLTFRVSDGKASSATAKVRIIVSPLPKR